MGVTAASGWLLLGSLGRFRRSGTTFDPLTPARAGALVTDGPNARTRNPMYLGMAGLLVGRALWRGRLSGLASAAAFAVAIDRFQIPAEEAALRQLFPGDYAEYAQRVPRWL
ncbi:MAG: isoprenylcysteine carboxylmethyltransferase family protein [Propionibacteriaceae bacterium]|nr:isoprenylcysteine carboxylmethyltransferase family protein [Propionibacteriaceae bacterium]